MSLAKAKRELGKMHGGRRKVSSEEHVTMKDQTLGPANLGHGVVGKRQKTWSWVPQTLQSGELVEM